MIIKTLSLRDFRNYTTKEVLFHPQVTRIVGDNAVGKTNLIEAIYFLGRGGSFRTHQRKDLIRHETLAAIIRASATQNDLDDAFAVEIGQGRTRFLRNGKGVRRPDAAWPGIVLFAPEETLLFRAGPTLRREYLDRLIEGVHLPYRKLLRDYQKVIQGRNRILHQGYEMASTDIEAQLAPWTDQLVTLGSEVIGQRRQWLDRLQELLPAVHEDFARVDGAVALAYRPHVASRDAFRETLEARHEEERARGVTVAGPQRDDLEVTLAGHDLRHFGSQGQHRSVVLALKLAEIDLARTAIGRTPILLLDDVASELDPGRLAAFLDRLQVMECQILLTSVHVGEALKDATPHASTITI
jgi:DNA replication and repair protein RecF